MIYTPLKCSLRCPVLWFLLDDLKFSLVDAASIGLPEQQDEIDFVNVFLGSPDDIFRAFDSLGKGGAISKRKIPTNGPAALRRTLEAAADKAEYEVGILQMSCTEYQLKVHAAGTKGFWTLSLRS